MNREEKMKLVDELIGFCDYRYETLEVKDEDGDTIVSCCGGCPLRDTYPYKVQYGDFRLCYFVKVDKEKKHTLQPSEPVEEEFLISAIEAVHNYIMI